MQIIPWVYVRRFNAHAYKDWITSMALEHGSHFKTGKHTDCFIWILVCICFLIKTRYGFKYISSENMCIFLFYKCWLFHCDFHFVKISKTCSILLIHDKHSLLYAKIYKEKCIEILSRNLIIELLISLHINKDVLH